MAGFASHLDFKLRRLAFHPRPHSSTSNGGLEELRKRRRFSLRGTDAESVESVAAAQTRLFRFAPERTPRRRKSGGSIRRKGLLELECKPLLHCPSLLRRPRLLLLLLSTLLTSNLFCWFCFVASWVQEKNYPRCTPRNSGPQSRDTPPKRDTGIANEKDWGISLLTENVNESGTNEDGSTWYREVGRTLATTDTDVGGQGWAWWEKSDWTGYKELGVEKSGRNAQGDSWWETWQEVLHQDEWSNLARIERSAQKQAKSGTENAGWYEKWWEKYDAKGWTEKGAHKYGRLNEQSWWEKWGEHYDGRGSVLKWTDKWAETELGTKWGDKWEEKFFSGIGSRQGETWHVSPSGEPTSIHIVFLLKFDETLFSVLSCLGWSRTWGEEHFGNGKVHKYGKSTTGESWDIVVDEETYYEAEPHYGWADVVGDSSQLLSIKPRERPPGVYPNLEFGSTPPPADEPPEEFSPQ
ncbi:hypothetical protein Prudu_003108 [Prunus dulcis]|uniref:Inactive purple acid phosphatase-like protein n=1 Tax=Prunus dulcis TaxID=3755 RepID=A0A4Y1QSD5_PRUDU|nr:hypothetical protein Prudu_003108 [Prunus dulcis]